MTRTRLRYPLAEQLAQLADELEERAHRTERGTFDRRQLERASLSVRRVAKSLEMEDGRRHRREAERRREFRSPT